MTAGTGPVFSSVGKQLPSVFSDTKAVARQIEELDRFIHAKSESPEEQEADEEAITGLHKQEDNAQQRLALTCSN